MSMLNLADIRYCTESEGPGQRIAVWAQGCPRACPGCCNLEMQAFKPANIVATNDLLETFEKVLVMHPNIEGITMVGGEPILQASGMATIAEWMQNHGKSVLLFTGFRYEELQQMAKGEKDIKHLLDHVDLLVDGPFLRESIDQERSWIGSTNQRVFRLSEFYPKGVEYLKPRRSMEIHIDGGYAYFNGWPCDVSEGRK